MPSASVSKSIRVSLAACELAALFGIISVGIAVDYPLFLLSGKLLQKHLWAVHDFNSCSCQVIPFVKVLLVL